ncbi:hypothetical protein CXB51_036960 [Gossypium anomalum]|uniref:DUF7745 domain-containing protein n=1 Tax=Gossypium anomalum TaxID=47600 RepID=A0A8J5Y0P4_9ROSI|nr:hypothetical protein CXB51_036960 [Gossypium anomalum]
MEKGFLDRVEDNTAVRAWSEKTQQEKCDSLAEGYESELWDFTHISTTQNNLQKLKDIWNSWNSEVKQLFYRNYGDLPYLLDVKIQADRAYSRPVNVPTFLKKLISITGMSEQWVAARIKQKGDSKCIPWGNLKDLILAHPDLKKRVDVFALSLYGSTPVPAILAETFRSLNAYRRAGEGRFIGCAQLLLAWFHSHFWKVDKVSYRVFSKDYSPLRELVATPRRDDISEEKWMATLQNLRVEDVEWRAPWLIPDEILYRCGDFDWVPLARIWGASRYAPLLVLRQYQSRQFIPVTQGRVNDNIPKPDQWSTQPIEEHLRVVPSELEIIKQDFEKRSSELGKKIEQLEEEKMKLGLDVDIHKLEAEKLRKGKNKAEEDLDSLKTDYKKLCMSIRTAGLGKMSEPWRQEIGKEKTRADQWEKKIHDVRVREDVLKKTSVSRIEELKEEIGKLETALQDDQIRNRDYVMGEAVAQVREVADHLQTLAVQADVLSLKYESELDRGRNLAWLLRKVKALGIRAKSYM